MVILLWLLVIVNCYALESSTQSFGGDENLSEAAGHMAISDESRLVKTLQARYHYSSRLARPVIDSSKSVLVQFGLSLQKILDFDEKNQVLTTLVWKEYRWMDELLHWDPAQYGGITTLSFPPSDVWIPDIRLYNKLYTSFQDVRQAQYVENLFLTHDGSVLWMPPAVIQSSCDVDPTNFPYDEQECSMKFGFWSYSSGRVDLNFIRGLKQFDLSEYKPNVEWSIRNNTAERHDIMYDCCGNNTFSDLTFTLKLERKSGFYTKVMLLPTLLLSLMVLALFWIPPQRPDRTSLGMSLFTNFLLLLLIVVESIPPSSRSKLATFCCCNIVGTSCATVFSIIMVNIASLNKTSMPRCIKAVIYSPLVRCLCVCPSTNVRDLKNGRSPATSGSVRASNSKTAGPENAPLSGLSRDTSTNANDWIMLTSALDRMCFLIYIVYFALSFAFVFPFPGAHYQSG